MQSAVVGPGPEPNYWSSHSNKDGGKKTFLLSNMSFREERVVLYVVSAQP